MIIDDENFDKLSKEIYLSLKKYLDLKERVNFFVSGGKSPIRLFQKLSNMDLDWHRINVFLVDERVVSTFSEDSNSNLVQTYLLQNKAAKAKFYGLDNSLLHDELALVRNFNNYFASPDVLVLGMGEDAHTASIFPKAYNLDELLTSKQNYCLTSSEGVKYKRITLSKNTILQSKTIFLSINSQKKEQMLNLALKDESKLYPISYFTKKLKVYYEKTSC
ncbi:6-phosphogluconolactonase [Campylobacter canadensis]|uniref:6-phosphogluconolactonase n=1 Tax=Campylobacter canadensis TaxID=449520 RepID=A0ABS7WRX6_9BACT|nr:6-phosphogluconolactonase [Campylobacter canadensis]MBZ7987126.1 6-phosphogluconolactonase [Campylobacter canadensis]MBZ7994520.1 6-phosphogluconolactonase [Campylobacter canadensis]MBZ7997207.1 6-phosphogluconolactonase [Campylobacter canadensis]MBZ7998250.1 6-phosphogluconolactonase [Campylobacter canadensis]MBZ7999765.1 6-phosphogluconolactonase [Campylobacter canadensis]